MRPSNAGLFLLKSEQVRRLIQHPDNSQALRQYIAHHYGKPSVRDVAKALLGKSNHRDTWVPYMKRLVSEFGQNARRRKISFVRPKELFLVLIHTRKASAACSPTRLID
jgi:hypothetical protein